MALGTVQDFVTQARILLQDTVQPYRYPDADILSALNIALLESRRLRPDWWVDSSSVPSYAVVDSTSVGVDEQYRTAVLFYVVGFVQLRDQEEDTDRRAASLLNKFTGILTGVTA